MKSSNQDIDLSPMPPSSSLGDAPQQEQHPNVIEAASKKAIEFANLVGKLKTTPRTGWVRRGVPRYESVADHSWRVAALTLLLVGRQDLDFVSRCLQMSVVHDMAECLVGDIAPDDKIGKEEKQQMEKNAIARIASTLRAANNELYGGEQAEKYLLDLFHEYELRHSNEAKTVKDLDLLDMIIQADEYEETFGIDLSDFFDSTTPDRFQDEWIRTLAQRVHMDRTTKRETIVESSSAAASLSPSDSAFIDEFSKASNQSPTAIEQVVKALRGWESRHSGGQS